MSIRLGIFVFLAAASWGQIISGQKSTPIYTAEPLLPEDSPDNAERNMIFYDNPRGPQPVERLAPAGTVSVEELQHPLSNKALKLLTKAQNFSAMGRYDKAIEELELALKEKSAVPYAHSILGQEYLKMEQIEAAIVELQQAVELLPHNAPVRSNLGFALFLSGNLEGAEQQARQALELDRQNPKSQHVLDQILAARRALAQTER